MDTKLGYIKNLNKDKKYIVEASDVIKNGGIVAFPTETVYGLGANALNIDAVKKIFKAKGRPQDNPLIVHISSKEVLDEITLEVPRIANIIMDRFWPGPLTMIFKKKDIIPNETSAGLNTIGIRMPSDEVALNLIKEAGVPIAAPSANISGRPSPTDMETCILDLNGRVDYILGSDSSEVGVESTILDITCNPPCILRPGGITLEMLKEIDDKIYIDKSLLDKNDKNLKPKAPGMKYKHYAPKAKVRLVEGSIEKTVEKINEMMHNYIDDGLKVGIMVTDETLSNYKDGVIISLGSRNNLSTIAKKLFSTLREFDNNNVDVIISESFEDTGLGLAIMNRLRKACGFDIIKV
ncbi:L-threonylcarbamoyladenylate synthase [Clostridium tarantellae]|uniref:Threonylcarbamoyl-AMP synthase n=1 Tax=Clostridium tarantellae TaxID=39493 RepID=A0A6I1MQG2_9CLOT|nr:L-threonylcarbamoyladenylate synthase [Clostridium tarantellae]MPQ42529.1 threonylcarbamoyl-AMP synthase [Clostridium tarantellae]